MYFKSLLSISQIAKKQIDLNLVILASGNSNISTFWTWPEMYLWKSYPEINILFSYCLGFFERKTQSEKV